MTKKSKNFRLDNEVQDVLEKLADANKCTQTAVIQDLLLIKAKELGLDLVEDNSEDYVAKLLASISHKLNEHVLLLSDGIKFKKSLKNGILSYTSYIRPGKFLKIFLNISVNQETQSFLNEVTVTSSVTYEETGHVLSTNKSDFLIFDNNVEDYIKIISDKVLKDCLDYSKILRIAKSSLVGNSFKGFEIIKEGEIPIPNKKTKLPKEFNLTNIKAVESDIKEKNRRQDLKVLRSLGLIIRDWSYEVDKALLKSTRETFDPEYLTSILDLDHMIESIQGLDCWILHSIYGSIKLEKVFDVLTTYRADFYKKVDEINLKTYYISGVSIRLIPDLEGTNFYLSKDFK